MVLSDIFLNHIINISISYSVFNHMGFNRWVPRTSNKVGKISLYFPDAFVRKHKTRPFRVKTDLFMNYSRKKWITSTVINLGLLYAGHLSIFANSGMLVLVSLFYCCVISINFYNSSILLQLYSYNLHFKDLLSFSLLPSLLV